MSRLILWIVTLLRVFLIPVFLFFAVSAQEAAVMGEDFGPYRFAALGTLFLMGASDLVAGWIARRYALMSQVGAVADAVADAVALAVADAVAVAVAVADGFGFAVFAAVAVAVGLLLAVALVAGVLVAGVLVASVSEPDIE